MYGDGETFGAEGVVCAGVLKQTFISPEQDEII